MRARLAIFVTTAVALTSVLTACDAFADYTVVNRTDEQLLTWALLDDCSVVVRNEDDYLHEEEIQPQETVNYSEVYSPYLPEPGCVQVATKDRRLVLAEPYDYGATYTVREPLRPLGERIPEQSELPSESWGEFFSQLPPILYVQLGLAVGFLAAFVFVAFITIRFFYRYYARKT